MATSRDASVERRPHAFALGLQQWETQCLAAFVMQIKSIHKISVNRFQIGVDHFEIGSHRFWPEIYANAVLETSLSHAGHSYRSGIAQCR